MKKILVIEQNEAFARSLLSILKSFRTYEIQHSVSIKYNHFKKILFEPLDILFINIGDKNTDGFYLAREIKKLKPEISVVFISDSERYATEAFEEDAADYLVFPLTKERLEVTLNRVG